MKILPYLRQRDMTLKAPVCASELTNKTIPEWVKQTGAQPAFLPAGAGLPPHGMVTFRVGEQFFAVAD